MERLRGFLPSAVAAAAAADAVAIAEATLVLRALLLL